MNDEKFNEQYSLSQASRERLIIKTAIAGMAAVIMFILNAIGSPLAVLCVFSMILTGFIFGTCSIEFFDGFISIFKLNPSNDSFNALACIAAMLHSLSVIISGSKQGFLFVSVLFFSIFISMLLKLFFVQEIINNLNLIKNHKTYISNVADINFTKKYINKVCMTNPVINFPENVIDTTYNNDPSELKSKLYVPVVCGVILIISVILSIFKGFNLFFMFFSAFLVIAASFSGEMAFVFPYIVLQRRLRKFGTVLFGYHSIMALNDIETVIVQDYDIFPQKRAEIVSIRLKNADYIVESLEYTAAILVETESPLKEAFIENRLDMETEKLPKIESWKFIKHNGIIANINGDEVLLGSRSLMLSREIKPLTQEQESTITSTGKAVLYLGINNELACVIVTYYALDPNMQNAAKEIDNNFTIIVETKDGTINEAMIQKRYEMSKVKIIVPDIDEEKSLETMKARLAEEEILPVMITTKNSLGIIKSIKQAKGMFKILELSILTKQVSIVFGLVLTLIAFFIDPNSVTNLWLFLFNILWTIPIIFLAFFKKS